MLRLQKIGAINIVNIDNATTIVVATCSGEVRSPFETIELQSRRFELSDATCNLRSVGVETIEGVHKAKELRQSMATYRQIQDWVRVKSGFVPKTCWIAHVKSDLGLAMRRSVNRYDHPIRVNPCPGDRRLAIEAALRHFEMAR